MTDATVHRDGPGSDDRAADARVLGQLLAAQNLMFVLQTDAQVADFFTEALACVPGIAWRLVCLGGRRQAGGGDGGGTCATCGVDPSGTAAQPGAPDAPAAICGLAADPTLRVIRVATGDRTYGCFLIRPDDSGAVGPYWPFLENLAGFIALSLENRGQRQQLEAVREDLERRVDARTRELMIANEALRESEERFRRITETVTDYVYRVAVADGQPIGTIHGAGSVAVTGYAPEDFAADPQLWARMVVAEDLPSILEQSQAVLAGDDVDAVEHRIVRRDGSVRWVRSTLVPQFDGDGRLIAYDGLIQDITERRVLEEQLLHAQKMESVGRLAGGVAHDFNNLLTAILGNVELAGRDLPSEIPADHPARRDLEEISEAGSRAASLTRQLLAFASKQRAEPEHLDVSAVVADSLKMLRRLLGEDIEIVTRLQPDLGIVEADPGQLQQVLVNLAVNARDAMPDGGRLVIETANETIDEAGAARSPGLVAWPYVRLSVTDTGSGMDEEVRARAFEPFFTTKERGKGTGLGLSICHGIVKQMGGQITVQTELGQGTTFDVRLPRVEGLSAAGVPQAIEPGPRGTERILVVEDEPAIRRLAVLSLRAQGYTVHEAAGGTEAVELIDSLAAPIDALITDVVMPGMSGPQLAERLARRHPGLKVLMMSGHAETSVLPASVGAEDGIPFLAKPFTPSRLAHRIREVLDAAEDGGGEDDGERAVTG